MERFWNDREQVRVPFVERFNAAVKGSEEVVRWLGVLGVAWGVVGVGMGVGVQ
jgi:hypothetical protein